ncbi:MAG: porin family protein [Hyphomicrobiales bacterium]|nr:porin family protein [Hyphomicrobiales bacterium]
MVTIRSVILMSLLTATGVVSAQAADLDLPFYGPAAVQSEMMEFGTGWYLRGDVAAGVEKRPKLDAALAFPPAGDKHNNWSTTLGFGYKYNNWFRTDLTFDYRHTVKANADLTVVCPYSAVAVPNSASVNVGVLYDTNQTCTRRQEASLAAYDVMLNGYFDLGTWSGVTPYVGAGLGVGGIMTKGSVNYYKTGETTAYAADLTAPASTPAVWVDATGNPISPAPGVTFGKQNLDRTGRSRNWTFAWALMAGVSYDLTRNAKLDLGYRYVNLGRFTAEAIPTAFKSTNPISAHELRAGIRYMID